MDQQPITVTFPNRAVYEAAITALAEKVLEPFDGVTGPSPTRLDVEDALRAMEAAR